MVKSLLKELKELNKEKGGLFENLIYRHFSIRITSLLINTKITPNQVTAISIILAFIAAFFYFRADYVSLVIGTIILNVAYTLDCVDGELARYKKLSSKFGAWWDGIGDRIVEYVVFSSLTLGLYFKTTNPAVLILGLFALPNAILMSTIRSVNRAYFDSKPNHEVSFGGKKYLASVDTFTVIVTVTTLLNQVYYFLLIYVVLGAMVWMRQIYRSVVKYGLV